MSIQLLNRTLLAFVLLITLGWPIAAVDKPATGKKQSESTAKTKQSRKKRKNRSILTESVDGPRRRLWLYARISSIFDSNIDHDEENIRSFGVVPSFGVHFQNSLEKSALEMEYETAFHSYSNTARWDRTSHKLRGSFERGLTSWLSSETDAEVTVKGSSEDRELNNQLMLGQEFQFRANRNQRFKLFGVYRIKRFPTIDSGRNSINPYLGGSFEQRLGHRRSLELSYRFERNRAWGSRNSYIRWTYGAEFQTPFMSPNGLLTIEAKYRPQLYNRIIEVEDANGDDHDEVRRDRRWIMGASWERPLNENLLIGLGYRFEARQSNDLSKNFNAHLAGVTFTYRWWR
jgi:hypothetical protein